MAYWAAQQPASVWALPGGGTSWQITIAHAQQAARTRWAKHLSTCAASCMHWLSTCTAVQPPGAQPTPPPPPPQVTCHQSCRDTTNPPWHAQQDAPAGRASAAARPPGAQPLPHRAPWPGLRYPAPCAARAQNPVQRQRCCPAGGARCHACAGPAQRMQQG
eukprot:scaffold30264_cov22-Tisochrysis_lutea.AAC.1